GSLPRPTKWFTAGPYFRAERPQRGRLREFLQWNADILGGEPADLPRYDAEIIAVCIDLLAALGMPAGDITVKISDRSLVTRAMTELGVSEGDLEAALTLLDRRDRLPPDEFATRAKAI